MSVAEGQRERHNESGFCWPRYHALTLQAAHSHDEKKCKLRDFFSFFAQIIYWKDGPVRMGRVGRALCSVVGILASRLHEKA